jgi:predicted acetyltransferase
MVFDDLKTPARAEGFARTFASDYRKVRFKAPRAFALEHFCSDYSQSDSGREIRSGGMVRVVNAARALALARYRGSGSTTLRVTDPVLMENDAVFRVDYEDGRASRVSRMDAGAPLGCRDDNQCFFLRYRRQLRRARLRLHAGDHAELPA